MKVLVFLKKNCIICSNLKNVLEQTEHCCEFVYTERGDKLNSLIENWQGDLILSIKNYIKLPLNILKNAKLGAVNFHPGSTKYRGSGAAVRALMDDSRVFGITCHLMSDEIDAGKILFMHEFEFNECSSLSDLLNKYDIQLFEVVYSWIKGGMSLERKGKQLFWEGDLYTIDQINKMREIPLSIDQFELDLRIKALNTNDKKIFINFHGYKFVYEGSA